jgi:hypothetical protein
MHTCHVSEHRIDVVDVASNHESSNTTGAREFALAGQMAERRAIIACFSPTRPRESTVAGAGREVEDVRA